MFANTKALKILEGDVVKIESGGVVLWKLAEEEGRLPSIYQEVEYIESVAANSQAHIDLGFPYDKGATIHLGLWVLSDETSYPFGAAENSGKLRCMASIPYSNKAYIYGSNATQYLNTQVTYVKGQLNEFVFTFKAGAWQNKNLTNQYSTSVITTLTEYSMTNNLYLFAQNYNGTPRFGATRRISYFKYYDKDDNLICDLVPCYRKSDGVIGMYDNARKQFLTNVGSGTFAKGADV